MSRKTALRLDDDSHQRTARVPASPAKRRPVDGRLVGEVVSIAFDRCDAPAGESTCGVRPESLCTTCATARCADHATRDGAHRCSACGGALLDFASAPFDDVLDVTLRLRSVVRF